MNVPSWIASVRFAAVRKTSHEALGVEEEVVAVFADPLHAEQFCHERNREICYSHPLPGQPRTVFTVEENRP